MDSLLVIRYRIINPHSTRGLLERQLSRMQLALGANTKYTQNIFVRFLP